LLAEYADLKKKKLVTREVCMGQLNLAPIHTEHPYAHALTHAYTRTHVLIHTEHPYAHALTHANTRTHVLTSNAQCLAAHALAGFVLIC